MATRKRVSGNLVNKPEIDGQKDVSNYNQKIRMDSWQHKRKQPNYQEKFRKTHVAENRAKSGIKN